MSSRLRRPAGVGLTLVAAIGLAGTVRAEQPADTTDLTDAVTVDGITEHLAALQAIATANGGNRAAGTPGYEASGAYVEQLLSDAGYAVQRQEFTYEQEQVVTSEMSVDGEALERGVEFYEMTYSADGSVAGLAVVGVDLSLADVAASTSGCEASDFDGVDVAGKIALLQRGFCDFSVKAENAEDAGAAAVIIFNQGNGGDDRTGLFAGTLGTKGLIGVPVVSTDFATGVALADGEHTASITIDLEYVDVTTFNVLADTTTGRADRTVVVGAHLDSVAEGPGINDNGSGIAGILEIALQMAELGIEPENRVRFAFWGGEEDGLIGSEYYVSQLSARDIKNHSANLNFDMIGSPNFARFIYDGDGDAFGAKGPNGSARIEEIFEGYFASEGLATLPTEFDGRSDYFAFINAGIPAGGLFTGAEGIKTAEEAAPEMFGGTAGIAYDPCYHSECDDIDNVSDTALDEMGDAAAHAVLTLAMTESAVNGTSRGKAGQSDTIDAAFRGHQALR
jgi:Zn-dependent M28 family amino/carboxypeptidase